VRLGRQVFIKIGDASAAAALAATWRTFAAHAIPGMLAILDLGEHEGRPYAVFEWLDGIALVNLPAEFQRTGGSPASAIDTIASQTLETLEALRHHGLVHGDISPLNIMVSSLASRTWLIDNAPDLVGGPVHATMRWLAAHGSDRLASMYAHLGSLPAELAETTEQGGRLPPDALPKVVAIIVMAALSATLIGAGTLSALSLPEDFSRERASEYLIRWRHSGDSADHPVES